MRLKRIKIQMLLLTSLQATQALRRNVDVCEMKNRLLQKKIAMTRLNPSSENIVNEYLNSIDD
jgi:hypothetical protein